MSWFWILIQCTLFTGIFGGCQPPNIDFVMWSDPDKPMVTLIDNEGNTEEDLGMNAFTYCLYFRAEFGSHHEYHSLISYSSHETKITDEIMVYIKPSTGETFIKIHAKKGVIKSAKPYTDSWLHICLSWSFDNRTVRLYYDGKEVGTLGNFGDSRPIGGEGMLVLGQDQDIFGGEFEAIDGVRGRITQFNVWNKVLCANEVKKVRAGSLSGNVVDWTTASWAANGSVARLPTAIPQCFHPAKMPHCVTLWHHLVGSCSGNEKTWKCKVGPKCCLPMDSGKEKCV